MALEFLKYHNNEVIKIVKLIPGFDKMLKPVLTAIKELGGSGTVDDIDNKVIDIRTYLKNYVIYRTVFQIVQRYLIVVLGHELI